MVLSSRFSSAHPYIRVYTKYWGMKAAAPVCHSLSLACNGISLSDSDNGDTGEKARENSHHHTSWFERHWDEWFPSVFPRDGNQTTSPSVNSVQQLLSTVLSPLRSLSTSTATAACISASECISFTQMLPYTLSGRNQYDMRYAVFLVVSFVFSVLLFVFSCTFVSLTPPSFLSFPPKGKSVMSQASAMTFQTSIPF